MKSSHIYTFVLFVQKSKCCCLNLNDHLRRKLAVLSINGSIISKALYWPGGLTEDVSGTETQRRTLTSNLFQILFCFVIFHDSSTHQSTPKCRSCTDVLSIPVVSLDKLFTHVNQTIWFAFRPHWMSGNVIVIPRLPWDIKHIHICHIELSSLSCFVSCVIHSFSPPPLITCVSILLNPTKSGSDPAVLLLNRGNGHQMCPSSPGNEMHTRTHWQTNRRLSCSVECVVDESRGPNITAALCLLAVTSGAEVG